jgi:proteasome lid subunit RPN8/RPN11
MWQSFLDKRGSSPEEKGYILAEEISDRELFAIFQIKEAVGSSVEVTSLEYMLDAIGEFTAKHPNIHLISYHTHPLDVPSAGDLKTFRKVYQEKYRNHVLIGPKSVRVFRAYADGSFRDLYGTDLLKIKRLAPDKQSSYLEHGKSLANEFLGTVKRFV